MTSLSQREQRSVSFEVLDATLLDALTRLVNLLEEPPLVPGLAPLIQQEITVGLLTGSHGAQLRHLVVAGSPGQQIAKVVAWLKQNFAEPLHGDDLAERAHMSPPTFGSTFRVLTGLSPLQYQKQLRLQEAAVDAEREPRRGSAAGRVGYESASQFSREYSRLFGVPPHRDVTRMRLASTASLSGRKSGKLTVACPAHTARARGCYQAPMNSWVQLLCPDVFKALGVLTLPIRPFINWFIVPKLIWRKHPAAGHPIFLVVHGTWGRNSKWTQKGELLDHVVRTR